MGARTADIETSSTTSPLRIARRKRQTPRPQVSHPYFVQHAIDFKRTFVRASDWFALDSKPLWTIAAGFVGVTFIGVRIHEDTKWWALQTGLMLAAAFAILLGFERLKLARIDRTLTRLTGRGGQPEDLDELVRQWFRCDMGLEPCEYSKEAHRLDKERKIAWSYACRGVTPAPHSLSTPRPKGHTAAWLIALLGSVLLWALQDEAARATAASVVFQHPHTLLTFVLMVSTYVYLAVRGVPYLYAAVYEAMGQLGRLHRGWPLDFMIRELLRLSEPPRARPRRKSENEWNPI